MEHVNERMYFLPEHFIRHCWHHFSKFSFWKSLIEIGETKKKQLSERSTCSVFVFRDLSESAFERKKTSLKRQFLFCENRIWRMQFLLDLGFWHSVEEAWTKFFPTQNWFICILKKNWKNHTFWRCKFESLFLFQYVSFWLPFYTNLFLLNSFLIRPSWGSDKSTPKSSPLFWVFKDNYL